MKSRIETIVDLVDPKAEELWDLCCDHGKIGILAYKHNPKMHIHFVDQVKSITDKLKNTVAAHIPKEFYSIECADIKKITFKKNTTLIMAGVGGHLIQKVLKNIQQTNVNPIQIILGPHQDTHFLRRAIQNDWGLISEILCIENGKGYEILSINRDLTSGKVSNIGHQMWDLTSEDHYNYALKFLKYYELKQKFEPDQEYRNLLNFFKDLLKSFKRPI